MPVDSFFYLLLLTGFCAGLMDAAVGGGVVGAKLAIRGGTQFLRYGFMVLLCLTIGKFAWDLIR